MRGMNVSIFDEVKKESQRWMHLGIMALMLTIGKFFRAGLWE